MLHQVTISVLLLLALALGACGSKTPEAPKVPQLMAATEEPKLVIGTFEVMSEVSSERGLPFLMSAEKRRVEERCFERVKKPLEWVTENPRVARMVEEQRETIDAALIDWYRKTLFPEEMLGVDPADWTVEIEKTVVRRVAPEEVAFAAKQTCITEESPALPLGAKTVTTLFGAAQLRLRSDEPLSPERFRAMKAMAKKQRMRLVPENAYARATDDDGEPLVGDHKEKLFNSPSGDLIPQKELPPPKERLTLEWKLVMPRPVFFACGDLPADHWQREALPDACEVYLVFDDAMPQVPECRQFKRTGFGAKQAKSKESIIIKVATDEATYTKEVPYNRPSLVQAGGRILLWVTPEKVEEGTHLKIDSLTLEPGGADFKGKAFPPPVAKKNPSRKKR